MKNIIPKYTAPETGNFESDVVDNSNANFTQLYNRSKGYGSKIQKFLMKLRSEEDRYETIRIGLIGDSILGFWEASGYDFIAYLQSLFPNKIFEKLVIKLGGTGSAYFQAGVWEMANYNPDLIIIGEWESYSEVDWLENMFKTFRERCSSDIAIYPFSMISTDMDLLSANDISGFIIGETQQYRNWYFSISQKYNCEILDIHQPWIKVLLDGTETSSTLLQDTIHPTDLAFSYWYEELDNHFSPTWDYEQMSYHNDGKYFKTIYFRESIQIPDFTEVLNSGTWDVNEALIDNSIACLRSSTPNDYIEFIINGIGFELSHFGDAVGQYGLLIDGVAPNTLLRDYATENGGSELQRMYKIIVNSNILDNDEAERAFYFTVLTVTRDVDDNITSLTYEIEDVTNAVVVGEGEATQDETFTYNGGSFTLPAMYAGVPNLRDVNNTFVVGYSSQFNIKKNWYDTIDISADNLTTVTRIFGLDRGDHTVRLTVNSGTVNLDSIMELK